MFNYINFIVSSSIYLLISIYLSHNLIVYQVALLSDQIDNQTDKITDLEGALDNKKETLRKANIIFF